MLPLFILEGIVVKGKSRGKALGFPTINFPMTQKVPEGIYISQIKIKQKQHNGLSFIGAAKTFGENVLQAETYVLDFGEDVYGQMVEVRLLKKIRDNQKFESKEKLIQQMETDKKQAEEYFRETK